MPPEGDGLTSEEIATVKAWIDAGAVWSEGEAERAAAIDKRKQHWSVQPVVDKTVLAKALETQPEHLSIDAFITAKLNEQSLAMSPKRIGGL